MYKPLLSNPPVWGHQKGVTPICSNCPVFFGFVPICVPCFLEYPDLFRFVPICSDFFRFVPICFQNKSEQIREIPFCRPLLQFPDSLTHHQDVTCYITGIPMTINYDIEDRPC